ncbi:MAG: YhdP family protein [Gallionella sp.]|nr:YhdP family protein [Gallionella sp.]
MWNSRPVRILWHSFNWLTRVAIVASFVGVLLLAVSIIGLRYWLLPNIERYHDQIISSVSKSIGRTVTIDKISGDWQGIRPRLGMENLSILDQNKQPALVLPEVHVSISWLTLLSAELRFASLEIDRPELLIRRDASGAMFVGGVPVANRGGDDFKLADWLLLQSRMVARNALIVWVDEQRGAPPLVLENVDVRIESSFKHHRFALRAVVPSELASPLDVRGDFRGSSFTDLTSWRGQVFTQLQYADITAWRAWLDMPKQFSRGHGAFRAWMDVEAGRLSRLQVDLAVRDVATKLADDVPEMIMRRLQGRVNWHGLARGFELETKELTMQLESGVSLPTTDLYLRILEPQGKQPAAGEIRANMLQLETLVSLANFVPIPTDLRTEMDAFAPSGKVDALRAKWQGSPEHLSGFSIKGKFHDISLRQVGKLPGFSSLTADVSGDQDHGTVHVRSKQLLVDAPEILREPLQFDSLNSDASWRHQGGELIVDVDRLTVSNDDIEGVAHGGFRTVQDTPGVLDLSVELKRADISKAARYTPLIAVNRKVNNWLHDALLVGSSDDFHLRLLGNLNDFPFEHRDTGQFEINAHFSDATVRYASDWPIVEHARGMLAMSGKRVAVTCSAATSVNVPLHDVVVTVPDIQEPVPSLDVQLKAAGVTAGFLQYIQQSPVRGYINGFTDPVVTQGLGELDLALRVPRLGEESVELQGAYRILNNQVDLGGSIPIMSKVNGTLQFTQSGLQTDSLTAEILGGPAQIDVKTTPEGGAIAKLSGTNNVDVWRKDHPYPGLQRVHGGAPWKAQIVADSKTMHVQINSTLQGLSSTLPTPFNKSQHDALPLTVNIVSGISPDRKVPLGEGQTYTTVQVGNLLGASVLLQSKDGTPAVKRAAIVFGGQAVSPTREGIWLSGELPEVSMQGWDGLQTDQQSASASLTPPYIDGADLHISKLSGYGHSIAGLNIHASRRGEGVVAQLSSKSLNGELTWLPKGFQQSGKLVARLSDFNWMKDTETQVLPEVSAASAVISEHTTPAVLKPGSLPALEIAIDQLQSSGKKLGRLELVGHPDGDSWRLRRILLTNTDGSLSGDGVWHGGDGTPKTQINLLLQISNAGKILDRSGFPNSVKDGSGKLAANLSWAGAPETFNLQTLEGTLKLDTGKGQFLKVDPGVGKLLSVLSLQALPKHIALDFTDVFSSGFQFDNINGTANIRNGLMSTQDFHIDGSAAKVTMKGSVDLNRETQDLKVEILPSIGSGVSLISAFAINPIVGLSAFVVDKILGNPLDKLVSFEYNINGTWADPSVVKLGEKPVPPLHHANETSYPVSGVEAIGSVKSQQPTAK